jgi:hypothetical protein
MTGLVDVEEKVRYVQLNPLEANSDVRLEIGIVRKIGFVKKIEKTRAHQAVPSLSKEIRL